jgi:hypothetical protein
MTVRQIVIGVALALLAAALIAVMTGHATAWALVLEASLVAVLVKFERSRYRSRTRTCLRVGFEPTDERFIDPTTGRTTVVFVNPATGERDYRD